MKCGGLPRKEGASLYRQLDQGWDRDRPSGGSPYVYYADGGWSWTVPYIAGVYALCAGVDPDITPEEFYRAAVETATVITRSQEEGGKEYTFRIMNPPALISSLQKNA